MTVHTSRLFLAALLIASPALAQPPSQQAPLPPGQSNDPFPAPIAATEGVRTVNVREFASLPDIDGVAARMMNLVDEPGTRRLFVNDMRGPIYSVSYDGKTRHAVPRHQRRSVGGERPVGAAESAASRASPSTRSSAGQGTPGFGKFYTYTDTSES